MRPSVISSVREIGVRGPRLFAGSIALILAFTAATLALDSGARAARPLPASPFFRLSPIRAVSPAPSLTRYSVTVTNAPVGDAPYARWYLQLKTPASAGGACSDVIRAGGQRLSQTRFVWKNQGSSFVWYHGAEGAYASDRSYGCEQSRIGHDGYPGTVTVVFENDSQHCTATFAGTGGVTRPEYGPVPVCALGGYIPLPVPRRLLQIYSKVDAQLTVLVREVQRGTLTNRHGALGRAVAAVLLPQSDAFGSLFPPVWGCGFAGVFEQALQARLAFGTQIAELAAGMRLPHTTLGADAGYMKALAGGVRACEPSASSPIGAPTPVVRAVSRLAAEASALSERAGRASIALGMLETELRGLDSQFEQVLNKSFPLAFGMRYSALLNRMLVESSSVELAQRAAQAGNAGAAVLALKQAVAQQAAIGSALHKQAARSKKAANSA